MISLSNDKLYEISLPVNYQLEDGILVLSSLPEEFQFTIQGKTSSLLAFELAAKNRPTKIEIKEKYDLSSDNVNSIFMDRMDNYNLNLIRNHTSSVPLELDSLVTKQVNVSNNAQIQLKDNYTITEQTISPDQIKISGPSSFVRYVDSLSTSKTVFRNVDRDIHDSIQIMKSLSELIQLDQNRVLLNVRVSKIVEHELMFSCADLLIANEAYDSILLQLSAPENFEFKSSQFSASIDAPVSKRPIISVSSNHPNIVIRDALPVRK